MKLIDIDTFLFGAYVTILAFEKRCPDTGAVDLDFEEIRLIEIANPDEALRFVQAYELLLDIDASDAVYAKTWQELDSDEVELVEATDARILEAMATLLEDDPDELVIDAALDAVCDQ